MKKIICGLMLLTVFLLVTCDNDPLNLPRIPGNASGTGRLTVNLDGTSGRTLLPQAPEFSRYALSFHFLAGGVSDINKTADSLPFSIELPPGGWRVTVTGYVYIENVEGLLDGDYPAASGEETVYISAGVATPVSVDLYRENTAGVKGVFQYDIGLPADALGSATLNILRTDRTVLATKNLLASASGSIALDKGYYFVQVRVVTGRVRSKTELVHIYGGHITMAAGAAWNFDTEEGVYLSLAELQTFLSAAPANTASDPYPVKLIMDWAALSTLNEFLGQMYSVLRGRYVSVDLSETVNVNGVVNTTSYSTNRNRLVSVVLPEGMTAIDDRAFYNCAALTGITIPDSVTSIGSSAFEGCAGLTDVIFNGTITSSGFSSINPFPGDLRTKYFDLDGEQGLYFTTNPGNGAVWTKGNVGAINAPLWREGNAISLVAPLIVFPAGVTVAAQGWQTSDTGNSGWSNFPLPATANASWNGKYLRYYATSSNGQTYYSNVMIITVIPTITVTNTGEWNTALNFIRNGGNNQAYTVNISGDIGVAGSTANTFGAATGISVILQGTGKLNLTSQGNMIRLAADQTLIIDSAGLTLQGLNGANNDSPVVRLVATAQLELRNGTISGNKNNPASGSNGGGGVYVNGGSFTMNGGEISGNTATYDDGGGVYVASGGTFAMNGGTICGNTASEYSLSGYGGGGGGVYIIGNGSSFTMNGGEIFGNTSSVSFRGRGYGGGVYVNTEGTFTMNGGEIYSNTSDGGFGNSHDSRAFGGGVCVDGTFTMNGGEIYGNTTSDYYHYSRSGGGVYVNPSGTFTINNGEIYDNTAYDGGGVSVRGTFTMNGGKISGNTASYHGSSISSGYGGGVAVNSGTFTMSGGEIYGNTAYYKGGGVFSSGTFRIITGTVYGSGAGALSNTAAEGAALYNDATAQHGTFNGATWVSAGGLSTTDDTISVVNGVLQ